MRNRTSLAVAGVAILLAGSGAIVSSGVWTAQGSTASSSRASHHGWPNSSSRSPAAIVHAAKAAAAGEGTKVLAVIEIEERSNFVDVGDPGESPGDYFLFEGRLMNQSGTKQVGRDSGKCTLSVRTFICDATGSIFHQGKIAVYGAFFAESDARLPIVGGTGAYREAGGTLTVTDLPSGNTLLVFEITE